ncbi:unnamed protein product [Rotaria sordida]|uniref:Uncharacterized protein n=1 Tax=Rotaria sordida TaxID=392033 RepID=A0A815P7K8_9BILA|nr:unnamed protein product [Rotaria sordida]
MVLELTCFNISSSLPTIPIVNNITNNLSHSYYNPNGKAISQLISSSLARSTFSIVDVRSFLKQVTSDEIKSWDVSTIVKLKPITSTIIFTSLTLALFILFSVIFCIISCRNCCKGKFTKRRKGAKNRKCSRRGCSVILLLLIDLIVIGLMIYTAYQLNRTRLFLDDSIKEVNQEIYPKEISFYLEHLLQQFKKLDQYSTQADSIVIKASHSVFVKGFDQTLRETYFLDEIRQSISDSIIHIEELDQLINQSTSLSPETYDTFASIKIESNNMINSLKAPLQKLCDYADGKNKEIDDTIIKALNLVHQQMNKLIDTIRNDFLIEITPWQNNMLMDKNLEDKIRWYIRLVGIILLVLTIVLGFIPITFFILIIICHLCCHQQNDLSSTYRLVHATHFIFVLNLFLYLL